MNGIRLLAVTVLMVLMAGCTMAPGAPAQRVAVDSRLILAEPAAATPVRFQGGGRVARVDRWQLPYCILSGAAASTYRVTDFRLDDRPTGRAATRFIDLSAQGMFGGEFVEYRSRLYLRTADGREARLTCATREATPFGSHLTREEIRDILGDAARLVQGAR